MIPPQANAEFVCAMLSWQKHRSWCDTGTAQRPRKKGGQTVVVTVTDPDTEAKKTDRAGLPEGKPAGDWRSGARMKPGRIKRFRTPAPVGNRSVNRPATRMSMFGVGPLNC